MRLPLQIVTNTFQKPKPQNPDQKPHKPQVKSTRETLAAQISLRHATDSTDITMYQPYIKDTLLHAYRTETQYVETYSQPSPFHTRSLLVDWLIDVHSRLGFVCETLFLTINIVDRMLGKRVVMLDKMQILGVTALFVAAKYEEVVPPSIETMSMLIGNDSNKETTKYEDYANDKYNKDNDTNDINDKKMNVNYKNNKPSYPISSYALNEVDRNITRSIKRMHITRHSTSKKPSLANVPPQATYPYYNYVANQNSKIIEEICEVEKYILHVLDYKIDYPSPMNFFRHVHKADNYDKNIRDIGKYLLDATMLFEETYSLRGSLRAVGCIYIARRIMACEDEELFWFFSGFRKEELGEFLGVMENVFGEYVGYEFVVRKYGRIADVVLRYFRGM